MPFPSPDAPRKEVDAFYKRLGVTVPGQTALPEWIEFDGWNCNDILDDDEECRGWDGKSRRCDCGNRRVYWDELKDGTRYAVAD